MGIWGFAVCRRGKDFSIADVEDRGAQKERLERFNVCVNDVPEEEISSNAILLIQNFLVKSWQGDFGGKVLTSESWDFDWKLKDLGSSLLIGTA